MVRAAGHTGSQSGHWTRDPPHQGLWCHPPVRRALSQSPAAQRAVQVVAWQCAGICHVWSCQCFPSSVFQGVLSLVATMHYLWHCYQYTHSRGCCHVVVAHIQSPIACYHSAIHKTRPKTEKREQKSKKPIRNKSIPATFHAPLCRQCNTAAPQLRPPAPTALGPSWGAAPPLVISPATALPALRLPHLPRMHLWDVCSQGWTCLLPGTVVACWKHQVRCSAVVGVQAVRLWAYKLCGCGCTSCAVVGIRTCPITCTPHSSRPATIAVSWTSTHRHTSGSCKHPPIQHHASLPRPFCCAITTGLSQA